MFNQGQNCPNSSWSTFIQTHEVPAGQATTGLPTFDDTIHRPTRNFNNYINTMSYLPPTTTAQATSNAIAISEGFHESPTRTSYYPIYLDGLRNVSRPEGSSSMGTPIFSPAVAQIPHVRNPWLGFEWCGYCYPSNLHAIPALDDYGTVDIPMPSIRVNRRHRSRRASTPYNTTHSNFISALTDQSASNVCEYEEYEHRIQYDTNNTHVTTAAQNNVNSGESYFQQQAIPLETEIPMGVPPQQRRHTSELWGSWDNRQTGMNNVVPTNSVPFNTRVPTVTTRGSWWVTPRLVDTPHTSTTAVNNQSLGRAQENEFIPTRPVFTLPTQRNPQVMRPEEAQHVAEQLHRTMYPGFTGRGSTQTVLSQPILLPTAQSNPQVVLERSYEIAIEYQGSMNLKSTSGVIPQEVSTQTVLQPQIQRNPRVVCENEQKIAVQPDRTMNLRSTSGAIPREVSARSVLVSDAQRNPTVVTEIAQKNAEELQGTLNMRSSSGGNAQEEDLAKTNHEKRSGVLKMIHIAEGQKMHFCSKCLVVYIRTNCVKYEFERQPPSLHHLLCPCITVHAGRSYVFVNEPCNPAQTESQYRMAAFTDLIQDPSRLEEWLQRWGPYLQSTGGLTTDHNCIEIDDEAV